jgi:hypothetical protein
MTDKQHTAKHEAHGNYHVSGSDCHCMEDTDNRRRGGGRLLTIDSNKRVGVPSLIDPSTDQSPPGARFAPGVVVHPSLGPGGRPTLISSRAVRAPKRTDPRACRPRPARQCTADHACMSRQIFRTCSSRLARVSDWCARSGWRYTRSISLVDRATQRARLVSAGQPHL